jgi:hypothetical protein
LGRIGTGPLITQRFQEELDMPTYVMLTRVSGDALRDPASLEELGLRVTEKLHADCPEVKWLASYAVLACFIHERVRT